MDSYEIIDRHAANVETHTRGRVDARVNQEFRAKEREESETSGVVQEGVARSSRGWHSVPGEPEDGRYRK